MTKTLPRFDWFLWAALLLVGGMLAVLGVLRYNGYNAGMLDLGNMAQAINSVLHGQPLVVSTGSGPISRVAGHAELVFFFLAPLYWRPCLQLEVSARTGWRCGALANGLLRAARCWCTYFTRLRSQAFCLISMATR